MGTRDPVVRQATVEAKDEPWMPEEVSPPPVLDTATMVAYGMVLESKMEPLTCWRCHAQARWIFRSLAHPAWCFCPICHRQEDLDRVPLHTKVF